MSDGEPVPGSLFIYAPNQIAPIPFAVAFALSAIGHIWQCHRYKSYKLTWLQALCAVFFTLGFALREYASYNYLFTRGNLIVYILSQVFIYICPPLLELANYHLLSRLISHIPHLSPFLKPSQITTTFGGLMALIEALNAVGVALAANPTSSQTTQSLGKHLTLAALGIQIGVVIIFVLLAGTFHFRVLRFFSSVSPPSSSLTPPSPSVPGKKQKEKKREVITTPLKTLYLSTALIFARCVYRLVEHAGNTTVRLRDLQALRALTPVLRYEWFFYVFEAGLMLVNSLLWNAWHPGRCAPAVVRGLFYLAGDGTEIMMSEEEERDGRSVLARVGNVFTFGVFFRRKKTAGEGGMKRKRGTRDRDGGGGGGGFEELRELTSVSRGEGS